MLPIKKHIYLFDRLIPDHMVVYFHLAEFH